MSTYLKKQPNLKPCFNPDGSLTCVAHRDSHIHGQGLSAVTMSSYTGYESVITNLVLAHNNLTVLPETLLSTLQALESLDVSFNKLTSLPAGFSHIRNLRFVWLAGNSLRKLPSDFAKCRSTLTFLDISHNPFRNLPAAVYKCCNLVELKASHIDLWELSPEIGALEKLEHLHLAGNALSKLPDALAALKQLQVFDVSGVRWYEAERQDSQSLLTQEGLKEFLDKYPVFQNIETKVSQTYRGPYI